MLDFEPKAGKPQNLSCDVYQEVRDAPLLVGQPAVAVVYADWRKHESVSLARWFSDP